MIWNILLYIFLPSILSSLVSCLLRSLANVLNLFVCFFFLLLSFKILCIFYLTRYLVNILCQFYFFASVFFQSLACLPISLIVFCREVFNFNQAQLFQLFLSWAMHLGLYKNRCHWSQGQLDFLLC